MTTRSWLRSLSASRTPRRAPQGSRKTPARYRPRFEALEDRTLLNSYLAATAADLITDIGLANAAGGTNTITLTAPPSSPYTLTAVNNTTDGPNGLPVIAAGDNLTIVGNGDTIERSTASGTPAFRLFDVAGGGSLTLGDLTLTGGLAQGTGGAVLSSGTLALLGVTVTSNTALGSKGADGGADGVPGLGGGIDGGAGLGGGISVGGTATLTNVTLSGNNATGGAGGIGIGRVGGPGGIGSGGGIFVGGTATLTNVTLSGNNATGGAGGFGFDNFLRPISSGNGGDGSGGGITVGGTATLTNDTLSGNNATGGAGGIGAFTGSVGGGGSGGGLDLFNFEQLGLAGSPPQTFLVNTLIAQNNVTGGLGGVEGTAAAPDVSGIVTTSDHDLIGIGSGFSVVRGNGDQVGAPPTFGGPGPINPLLGPLQDNGGPTQTMALLPGSPAIDAGDINAPNLPATDQRGPGFPRTHGGTVDIGAFETQPIATTTAVTTTAATSTYGASVTFTATVTGPVTPTGSVNFVIDGGPAVAGTAAGTTGTSAAWTYTTSTLAAGTHTVGAFFVGSGFADSDATLGGGQLVNKANATVVVTPYSVTYDGSPHTATVASITGVNGETGPTVGAVTLNTTHTDANPSGYSDSWSFVGGPNYNDIASTPITDVINKAPSTTTVTIGGGPFTYNGLPQTPATVMVTGAGGLNLTPAANYANNVNAGTATASYVFAGDANHTGSSDSKNFSIGKADATVAVTPYNVIYDGSPHTATDAISGVPGETGATVGAVTLNTTHTNPGSYASDSWSFTGGPNYKDIASTTITDTINKATLTITADDDSKVSGTLKTFSSTAFTQTGLVGGDTITGVTETSTGAAVSAAVGTYPIVPGAATGTGLGNYTISYVNGTLTVFSPPPTPSPAPPVSDPLILSLSPMEGRALQGTMAVAGLGFTPGSVLLVNGQPLATLFGDAGQLFVPGFLPQLRRLLRVRRHGRLVYVDDGLVAVQVLVPGVGLSPVVLLLVDEVAPGDIGTAAERAIAESWERRHNQEADTAPAFQRLLRHLRAHGI
jgi:hypothetical protein